MIFKKSTKRLAALAAVVFATAFGATSSHAITYSLSLGTSSDWIYRGGDAMTLSFEGLVTPYSDAILTVSSRGDINDLGEFVVVNGEDNTELGTLFDGFSSWPEVASLLIPYASLSSWVSDGVLSLSLLIPTGNGSSCAWLQSASLTYESIGYERIQSQAVPDAAATLSLFVAALSGLALFRRSVR